MPKCLTEINGVSILERLVHCLAEHGFKRLVVVVGHQQRCIREYLGCRSAGLTIDYVVNPVYRNTNNIYSLWLAKEMIRGPFLLVESDLLFDAAILEGMLAPDRIAVSLQQPWMHGSTVAIDPSGRVEEFQVGASADLDPSRYKTVNIYSLAAPTWRRVLRRLGRHVSAGKVNEYYETVFAEMVTDGSLSFQAVVFEAGRWHEVDTLEDLDEAERVFCTRERSTVYKPCPISSITPQSAIIGAQRGPRS